MQILATSQHTQHLFVFDHSESDVLEVLTGDVENLYPFSIDVHAGFITFLEQNAPPAQSPLSSRQEKQEGDT